MPKKTKETKSLAQQATPAETVEVGGLSDPTFWGMPLSHSISDLSNVECYIDPFDFRQVIFHDHIDRYSMQALQSNMSKSINKQMAILLKTKHFGMHILKDMFFKVVNQGDDGKPTSGGVPSNGDLNFGDFEIVESITEGIRLSDADLYVSLNLTTGGGSVISGFQFINWVNQIKNKLQSKNLKIEFIAVGNFVASMGVPLFLVGDKRYIAKNTVFLIHPIATIQMGKLPDLKAGVQFAEMLQNKIVDWILERTKGKLKKSILLEWVQKETYIDAPDLIKYGFADGYISE